MTTVEAELLVEHDAARDRERQLLNVLWGLRSWLVGPAFDYSEREKIQAASPEFVEQMEYAVEIIGRFVFVEGKQHPLLRGTTQ